MSWNYGELRRGMVAAGIGASHDSAGVRRPCADPHTQNKRVTRTFAEKLQKMWCKCGARRSQTRHERPILAPRTAATWTFSGGESKGRRREDGTGGHGAGRRGAEGRGREFGGCIGGASDGRRARRSRCLGAGVWGAWESAL
jgi:hypothetical protein